MVATVCTVGFGDLTPFTSDETVFVIFVQLAGLAAYSLLMGGITSTEKVPTVYSIQQQKIIEIESFL